MLDTLRPKGSAEYHLMLDEIITTLVEQSKQTVEINEKFKLLYLAGYLIKIRLNG